MNAVLNQLFTLVLAYGYPIIGLSVFISSIGIPLPTIVIVLSAGALAALGDLNIIILFFIVTICGVLGDVIDYWLGAKVGYPILYRITTRTDLANKEFEKIQKYFFRWSGITIFLTRWLFSLLESLTNILAGMTKYSFRKFLFFDILGQIVYSVIFLGLGYLFSSEWQNIWTYVQSIFILLAIILGGLILIVFGIKRYKKAGKVKRQDSFL
jgi:membrane-associated protein